MKMIAILALVIAVSISWGCQPTSLTAQRTLSDNPKSDQAKPEETKIATTIQVADITSFIRGEARIALGMTKEEVKSQLSRGRHMSHKWYNFQKPDEDMFAKDIWYLTYGPEVPGMGRYDTLTITFKDGKAVRIQDSSGLAP
jgi:hypothetical protein